MCVTQISSKGADVRRMSAYLHFFVSPLCYSKLRNMSAHVWNVSSQQTPEHRRSIDRTTTCRSVRMHFVWNYIWAVTLQIWNHMWNILKAHMPVLCDFIFKIVQHQDMPISKCINVNFFSHEVCISCISCAEYFKIPNYFVCVKWCSMWISVLFMLESEYVLCRHIHVTLGQKEIHDLTNWQCWKRRWRSVALVFLACSSSSALSEPSEFFLADSTSASELLVKEITLICCSV